MKKILYIMLLSNLLLGGGFNTINYSDNFNSVNFEGRLGAGIYSDAHFIFDENGIDSGAYLKAKVKLFKHKFEVTKIRFTGDIDPTSFANTKLGMAVSVYKKDVYATGSNMLVEANVSIPDVNATDVNNTQYSDSNRTTPDMNTSTQLKQKIRAAKMKKAKNTLASLGENPIIGLNKILNNNDLNITIAKEYGSTLFIGPIPLYVEAGVGGEIGFNISAGLEGISKITGFVEPYGKLGGYAKAGVGGGFQVFRIIDLEYSAGATGEMNLVSDHIKSTFSGELNFACNDDFCYETQGNISENITNTFKGPNGKLKRYISYYGPSKKKISRFLHADGWYEKAKRFKDLGNSWRNRTYTHVITDWSSYTKENVLLDETQNAFTIPMASINEDIILYDDYNCQGNDIGVFDSRYDSDVACNKSVSCENNKAKSILLRKETLANTKISVYDNPKKKTSKYDFTTIRIGSSGLSDDFCVNGFEHNTTSEEETNGLHMRHNNINNTRKLNGNISHIKVYHD